MSASFFELGGNSLLIIRFLTKLKHAGYSEIELIDLYDIKSVSDLCDLCEKSEAERLLKQSLLESEQSTEYDF